MMFGIRPAVTFGAVTCKVLRYSADFGFNASCFGGLAIAVVRLIYLKVSYFLENICWYESFVKVGK